MKNSNKSRTLRAISRLIGYIGVGACLIGALVYLILLDTDVIDRVLKVEDFYPVAGLAVVFIVIAVIIRIASGVAHANEKKAAQAAAEAELAAAEPVAEEVTEEVAEEVPAEEEEEILVEENDVVEFPAEEEDTEPKCDMADKICEQADPNSKKCQICMAMRSKKLSAERKAKVAAVAGKTAPVAVAVAATATLAAVIGKRSTQKKIDQERDKIRRAFFDIFY